MFETEQKTADVLFTKKQLLIAAVIFIFLPLLLGLAFRPKPVSVRSKRQQFDRQKISQWVFTESTKPVFNNKVDINLNNQLSIIGINLPTEPLIKGQTAQASIFFKVQQEIERDWVIFGHVDAKNGKNRIHADHPPVYGRYPTSLWRKNEIIEDKFDIELKANTQPGIYDVFVGLYIGAERLKVLSKSQHVQPEDKLLLGQIRVK